MISPRNKFALLIVVMGLLLSFLMLESAIMPLATLTVLSFIVLSFKNTKLALFILFAAKPIVDATWGYVLFADITLLHVTGVYFPMLAVIFFLQRKNSIHFSRDLKALWSLYLIANLLSAFLTVVELPDSFTVSIMTLFQATNAMAAFFLLPSLLETDRDWRLFLVVLVLAGIFPIVSGILQIWGLLPGLRTLKTTGELVRISGWYYDSSNLRFYAFQSFICIVLAVRVLKITGIQKWLAITLALMALFVLYRTYSKSGLVILLFGSLVYFLLHRQMAGNMVVVFIALLAYFFSDRVSSDVDRLLWKEIKYVQLEERSNFQTHTLLAGRIGRWEVLADDFFDGDIPHLLTGRNYALGRWAHNDFIRHLYSTGFFGFLIYSTLLLVILWRLISVFSVARDEISILSIILWIALFVDSLGLTMTLQPAYCWFTFGVISYNIHRRLSNSPTSLRMAP